jgi:metal-sulfur cluster biosynthetic enzyme
MGLDKEKILAALKQVYDPEIPVDIVNLGLVYDIGVEQGRVNVKITTTAPGCPVGNFIAAQIKQVIRELAEVDDATRGEEIPEIVVEIVHDPPWDMNKVSEEGRRALGWE